MGKKHPLDIFRSHDDGFGSASRSRRTVTGKVVSSAPRVKPAEKPHTGDSRRAPPRGPGARGPRWGVRRWMMTGTGVVVVGLTLYLVGANFATPALKAPGTEEVFRTGPRPAASDAVFVIEALALPGSEAGRTGAVEVARQLRERGYPEVQVLGFPPVDQAGLHAQYKVFVGRTRTRAPLGTTLQQLKALPGPPGHERPFAGAQIVEAPKSKS